MLEGNELLAQLRNPWLEAGAVAALAFAGYGLGRYFSNGLLVDHYVAVLDVNEREVLVADPSRGRLVYRVEDFAKEWRFTGIVLQRPSPP